MKEKLITYMLLTVIAAILILPFFYMISIALSSDKTVAENAFTVFPREYRFDNVKRIFATSLVGTYVINSIKLCLFAIVGQLVASSFVAYGFARLRAKGKNFLFMVLLATMMIPAEVTMIPQFLIFRSLGMIDTLYPLVLPNFFGGAFNIFLLRQSVMRIPYAFDEAAIVEGVSYPRIWLSLILPMIKPILVAIGIFTFSWNWGWFTGPLIYLSSPEKFPLALGVYFITETSSKGAIPPWNLIMVTALMLTLPMILVYALGQKYVYTANIGSGSSLK
jgi:multiple sugar transport system permease protein